MLVLVDRARPEKLGELVRHVVRAYPEAEVLTEAPGLATLPEGSTAVLCVRAMDAWWLNQERPVVQARALRVILFSDEATTLHLAREAVDFYDWISHRIDCPEGPPAFAVRALRRTACARAAAVVWTGGDLEGTFARALPGRRLVRVSAAQSYVGLVEVLRPRARTWVAAEDVDGGAGWRRARWGAAEAGRRGRLVLVQVQQGAEPNGIPRISGRALAVEESARRLRGVGIGRAAWLATMLELEPAAIDDAATLAEGGVPEAELARLALREEDPGAALARLAGERRNLLAPAVGTDIEEMNPDAPGRLRLPEWPARIELATAAGDTEVASHWAAGWTAATRRSARAVAALARIRLFEQNGREARTLLDEAHRRAKDVVDEDTRLDLLRADGPVLFAAGETAIATHALEEAIILACRLGRSMGERSELYDALVRALIDVGRSRDAERVLNEWMATLRTQSPQRFDPLLARARATLMLAQGDAQAASQLLELILAEWPEPEHPTRGVMEHLLAQAWIEQGRYGEAERLLRGALERLERVGRRHTFLRHEHGRALLELNRFREAEQEFRRVLAEAPEMKSVGITRHELARCLTAQGRIDEAEALLDLRLKELTDGGSSVGRQYAMSLYEKARIQRQRGNLTVAAEFFRKVLTIEEHSLGREHPTLVPILAELGETLIELGQPREAEPLLRRAVRSAEKTHDPVTLAVGLGDLARAQAAQNFSHARDTAHRALAAWDVTGRIPSPALHRELKDIAAGPPPRPSPSRRHR